MNKALATAALTAACAAIFVLSATAQAQQIGITAAIHNSVKMRSGRDAVLRPAVLKDRVSLGDDIVTGPASVDQLLLLDRSVFTIGANARARIDRFVYDPSRNASAVSAAVAKGAFRFMSGRSTHAMPGQSHIITPVGSMGIRGTIVEGAVGLDAVRIARGEAAVGNTQADSDSALLVVLRGPGPATQGGEYVGAVDVPSGAGMVALERPGMALFVPGRNRAAIGPFMISDAGLDALHALLRTSPARRNSRRYITPEGNPVIERTFACTGSTVRTFIIKGVTQTIIEPGTCGG